MTLDNQDIRLLTEILSVFLKSSSGLDALRFRADNEQYIRKIDQLEKQGYLQRENKKYTITVEALVFLSKNNPEAKSLLEKCNLVFTSLKEHYKRDLEKMIKVSDISNEIGISNDNIGPVLKIIVQTQIGAGYSKDSSDQIIFINPSEHIFQYGSFNDVLKERAEWRKIQIKKNRKDTSLGSTTIEYKNQSVLPKPSSASTKANWKEIEESFGVRKTSFGKKINFIRDPYKRMIIFRDVEQAFVLASLGFSKPAVILAGGVIEEMLRLYLEYKQIKPAKNNFAVYIQTCEQHRLLKDSVSRLSDSVRQFRNLVHVDSEKTRRHTIPKATAVGAVSSIFTVANDF